MNKLSIIIPCYNEGKTMNKVLKKVKEAKLPQDWEREIIIVDDGSEDNTKKILRELKDGDIKLIFKEKNEGKGAALKKGFEVVSGDYILIQDADLEYNPNDYIKLFQPIIKGKSDIVFGLRTLKRNDVPFSRLHFYGGLFICKIFNLLFGTKLADITTCYKLFPRNLISKLIYLPSNDFVFDAVELTYCLIMNGKIVEVPIDYRPRSRKEGKKINWRDGVRCLLSMLKIKFSRGQDKI